MEARRGRHVAEKRVLRQEPGSVRVVEPGLGVDEVGLLVEFMPREGEPVCAGADSVTFVSPGVVEDRLPGGACGLRQADR